MDRLRFLVWGVIFVGFAAGNAATYWLIPATQEGPGQWLAAFVGVAWGFGLGFLAYSALVER